MTTSVGHKETASHAGPLWSRDFVLFFIARAVAKLGEMMLPVALAAGFIQHGYGAGAVGIALAAYSAFFAGFVIFAGVIADRFNTRVIMISADVVRVGTQSLAAAMFFTGNVVLWPLCVIGALNGLCSALFQPGVASTIPRLAADVQGANAVIRSAESVMSMAGPAVAGVVIGFTSAGGVFTLHATTFLVSAVCLLLMRLPAVPRPARTRSGTFRADLAVGWREFRARTWMWGVIAVWMFLMITVFGPTMPLAATALITAHGAGTFGLVSSAFGAGMVAGGLLAMRIRPRYPLRAGSLALLAFCLQPATAGAQLPVPLVAVGFAASGAAMAFWGVMWATSVQTQVPHDVLNRTHAYEVAGSLAMMPVGQALAGPAASLFGLHGVLLACGVLAVAGATTQLSIPAIRNLRRADGGTIRAEPA